MPGHTDEQGLPTRDRWIAWALLASLVLHGPLLIPEGVWRRGWPGEAPTLPLEVRIELIETQPADGPAVEQAENAPPAATELASLPAESRVVPDPLDPPAITELLIETVDSESRGLIADEGSTVQGESSGPVALPTETEGDAVTEPAEAAPAEEPVPAADVLVATVAPAETARLTRRIVQVAQQQLNSSASEGQFTFEDQDRRFTAVFTKEAAAETGIERVMLELTTEHDGEHLQTSLQMKRLTFSHFTQLVDRWDERVQLHDDEIAGRFHSNSAIHLTYDQKVAPRLLGKVTTTRGILIDDARGWRPRGAIFAGGLDTRSARIRLPQISLPVPTDGTFADADVRQLHADARVVFRTDGVYDCIELASGATERGQLENGRLTYIVGSPGTELYVSGVVNGNVTVYSPERIVVEDDLTYARDPRSGHGDSDAYLGLVSDGNIEIDRPEVTGPGDLQIHGAVYARKRFVVRHAGAPGRATLSIYGSLTAGTVTRTEPRYATRIQYDPRFERRRPPGFPQTDRYEIDTWDQRWRVAETP